MAKGFELAMLALTCVMAWLLSDPVTSPMPPNGNRAQLSLGHLFVPEGLRAADGPIDLVVHLHGSSELMERNLSQAGGRALLVTISLNGLSSVYQRQFAKPERLLSLIDEATVRASPSLGSQPIKLRRVLLSSFSAGFGGVREILKSPDCYQRIDAIVMADSIYAGYIGEPLERQIDPGRMQGFLRFATDAAAGRKQMVISHCQLQPEGYASTAETADYLIQHLMLERRPCLEKWGEQWQCSSRCERSGLQIVGFSGTTGSDHLMHLRNIGRLWSLVAR